MKLVFLLVISVVMSVAGSLYLTWFDRKEAEQLQEESGWCVWLPKGKRLVFVLIMLTALLGMSVWLTRIYTENGFVHNAEVICLLCMLFLAANVDARKEIIPNTLILLGLGLRVVFWVAELCVDPAYMWMTFKNEMIAVAILGVFFFVCGLVMKGGIGMGDIKLILVMCLFQGLSGVLGALFCSMFAAFVIAVAMLIMRKKTRKDAIPFAPSILLGALASAILTGM